MVIYTHTQSPLPLLLAVAIPVPGPVVGIVRQTDWVGELVVQLRLALLRQRQLGHRLEGQVDIVSVLGRRLKVRDVVLWLAPHLCPVPRHLIVQVALVAEHDEREVVGITGTRLYQELVVPRVEVLERVGIGDVEDEDTAVSATVEGDSEWLEAL